MIAHVRRLLPSLLEQRLAIPVRYDTMAGVGVTGGMKADQPKKGRHWSTWVAIVAVMCVVGFLFPRLAMKGFGMGVGGMIGSLQKGVTHGMGGKANPLSGKVQQPWLVSNTSTAPGNLQAAAQLGVEQPTNDVFCTGYVIVDGHVTAFLSDGSELSSTRKEIKHLSNERVDSWTHSYPVRRSVQPAQSQNYVAPFEEARPVLQPVENYVSMPSVSVTTIGQSYLKNRNYFRLGGFSAGSPSLSSVPGQQQTSSDANVGQVQ
jgi:hypothetical protein